MSPRLRGERVQQRDQEGEELDPPLHLTLFKKGQTKERGVESIMSQSETNKQRE